MSDAGGVQHVEVRPDDAAQRLDRWLKRRFPQLPYGYVAKILRTGQVRLDGHRAKPGDRLAAGQMVRIPPVPRFDTPPAQVLPADQVASLRASVLYMDDDVIAINKPPGLAVQGGTGTHRHLDGLLCALQFGAVEKPRLVHRLDKDTGGVLLLARHAKAARFLATAFKRDRIRKTYWALVAGIPAPRSGLINAPLVKRGGSGGEKAVVDTDFGKPATTEYEVIDVAGRRVAWLSLTPRTGRTHQLRVHLASIGTPVVGDGKYGGAPAFVAGLAPRMHLHARAVQVFDEKGRPVLRVVAPLRAHMAESCAFLGFETASADGNIADSHQRAFSTR